LKRAFAFTLVMQAIRSVEQAGAVAVRGRGSDAKVLIVRARKNPDHWIFPKGHIEKGESAEDAARRELREEGGVDGVIGRLLGVSTFQSSHEQVKVSYYLVRFARTVPAAEVRETRWTSFDEARRLLTFDDARELLDAARQDV
jgi:8-oxo-dGTP pyrophosphatase MutT (NUDIX family)